MAEEILEGGEPTEDNEVEAQPEKEVTESEAKTLITGEDDKDADESKDSLADADKGAPEQYDDFVTPEGVELVPEIVEEAKTIFKDMGLSQDQAQTLVDFNSSQFVKAREEAQEAWDNTLNDWEKSSKDDKEFGGADFDKNLSGIRKAVKHFGNDEFREILDHTGVGSHPEMLRFLHKVSAIIKDDDILHGERPAGPPRTQAERIFTTMDK